MRGRNSDERKFIQITFQLICLAAPFHLATKAQTIKDNVVIAVAAVVAVAVVAVAADAVVNRGNF